MERTKIDIISGFLGAGKTTLIKKLLKDAFKGEQVVLIENEFGEIGIDGGFLKEAGIDIYGFACFDAPEFALFRMVTDKADEAEKILTENGYMNRVTEVIAVDINAVLESH